MIAVYLSPLYFFGTWLLTFMFLRWLSVCSEKGRLRRFFRRRSVKTVIFLMTFCMSLMLPLGFFLDSCSIKYFFLHIGSAWMGVLLYSLLVAGVYLVYCLVWWIEFSFRKKYKITKKTADYLRKRPARVAAVAGAVSLTAIAVICTYGIYNAGNIKTTEYSVRVEKSSSLEKIDAVMVADLHLGYNIGCAEMRRMVDKINACNPDIVFICGDIFDNDMDALDNPEELTDILASIKTKYGVYACYGNHDINEKVLAGFTFDYNGVKLSDPRMDEFLEEAGITLLKDEGLFIADAFYLYGRADYAKTGMNIEKRKTPEMIVSEMREKYPDRNLPVIVLDHEPKEARLLGASGVDLVLSGHTHDGQIFPANILVSMLYDNSYGYAEYGSVKEIVSSGVGLFGPYMRVGTVAEICDISISFGQDK